MFFYLSYIDIIRRRPSDEECKVIALVISRLDCNVLSHDLTNTNLQILKRIQNYIALIIVHFGKDENVTPVLHDLHWLPIEMSVYSKVLLNTYRGCNGHAPSYI